ncbi:MAG: DEAD/DEAH box helicase [Candidatus Saganbacteria bacterium]|nr:DEAD/DEAH box helicase [Candidatus Saganbacteria bacterium]
MASFDFGQEYEVRLVAEEKDGKKWFLAYRGEELVYQGYWDNETERFVTEELDPISRYKEAAKRYYLGETDQLPEEIEIDRNISGQVSIFRYEGKACHVRYLRYKGKKIRLVAKEKNGKRWLVMYGGNKLIQRYYWCQEEKRFINPLSSYREAARDYFCGATDKMPEEIELTARDGCINLFSVNRKQIKIFVHRSKVGTVRLVIKEADGKKWLLGYSGDGLVYQGYWNEQLEEFVVPPDPVSIFKDQAKKYYSGETDEAPRDVDMVVANDGRIYLFYFLGSAINLTMTRFMGETVKITAEEKDGKRWILAYCGDELIYKGYWHKEGNKFSAVTIDPISIYRETAKDYYLEKQNIAPPEVELVVPAYGALRIFVYKRAAKQIYMRSYGGKKVRLGAEEKEGKRWILVHDGQELVNKWYWDKQDKKFVAPSDVIAIFQDEAKKYYLGESDVVPQAIEMKVPASGAIHLFSCQGSYRRLSLKTIIGEEIRLVAEERAGERWLLVWRGAELVYHGYWDKCKKIFIKEMQEASFYNEKYEQVALEINKLLPDEYLPEFIEHYEELAEVIWNLCPEVCDQLMVKRIMVTKALKALELRDLVKPTTFDMPNKNAQAVRERRDEIIQKLQNILDKRLERSTKATVYEKAVNLAFLLLRQNYYQAFCENDQACLRCLSRDIRKEEGQIRKAALKLARQYYRDLVTYAAGLSGLRPGVNLWPFQVEAVRQILKQGQAILADEMGSGKTVQTLVAAVNSGARTIFIVCPEEAKQAWVRDLYRFIDGPIRISMLGSHHYNNISEVVPARLRDAEKRADIEFTAIAGGREIDAFLSDPGSLANGQPHFVIINYENLIERNNRGSTASRTQLMNSIEPDFLIVDEAHGIKNTGSERSRQVRSIQAARKVLVTGTPLENRAEDLYAYLSFLMPATFHDRRQFEAQYGGDDLAKMGELHQIVKQVMIRRKKDQVLSGLPDKVYQDVMIDPGSGEMFWEGQTIQLDAAVAAAQRQAYEQVLDHYIEWELDYQTSLGREVDNVTSSTKITRLQQAACDPGIIGFDGTGSLKYLALDRIIEEKTGRGEKVVVFSPYSEITQRLKARYESYGVAYMDGEVGKSDRLAEIDQFQNGEDKKVFVATIGTGGQSISLTAAATVVFFNKPLKPSTVDQAIDRIHRIDEQRNAGRENIEVVSLILGGERSIDLAIENLLLKKRIISDIIIDGLITPEIREELARLEAQIFEKFRVRAENGYLPKAAAAAPAQTKAQQAFLLALNYGWDTAAELYASELKNLAPYWIHWLKNRHLVRLSLDNRIEFPSTIMFAGSGPSISMRAWQELAPVLARLGLPMPVGTDLDLSHNMIRLGVSANRVVGNMVRPPFGDGKFDMVDNASLSLVPQHQRARTLAEAHRVLKDNGYLAITTTDREIGDDFVQGIQELGFDVVSRGKAEIDDLTYGALRAQYGEEIAKSIKDKTGSRAQLLLARKARPLNPEVAWQHFQFAGSEKDVDASDRPLEAPLAPGEPKVVDLKSIDLLKFSDPILERSVGPLHGIVYRNDLDSLSRPELIAEIEEKVSALRRLAESRAENEGFFADLDLLLSSNGDFSAEEKSKMIAALIERSHRLLPIKWTDYQELFAGYSSLQAIPEQKLRALGLIRETRFIRGVQTTICTHMLVYYFKKLLARLKVSV